jgi:hypothetical protein
MMSSCNTLSASALMTGGSAIIGVGMEWLLLLQQSTSCYVLYNSMYVDATVANETTLRSTILRSIFSDRFPRMST